MKLLRLALAPRAAAILAALLLAFALVPRDAAAQFADERGARVLTGALKRIKDTGGVRIGYRESAVPFSYRGPGGQPYGYSIDLCLAIVDELADAVGRTGLRVDYVPVTPADRILQVTAGRIDLECGATTNTSARREKVAFSPVIFVAGTQLLVIRGSKARSLRDLAGRSVVVVRDTANEEAMRRLLSAGTYRVQLKVADDYDAALAQVASGTAAALAADDILLYAYVAERGLQRQFAIVGELLSYEPYGIMYAKHDAALDDVVRSALTRLATSREIRTIYNRWFLRPLPSGVVLGLPMSVPLERALQLLGMPAD